MLSVKYDEENGCAYLKQSDTDVGILYGIHSVVVNAVGAFKKVIFYNGNGLPSATLFCDYSELK